MLVLRSEKPKGFKWCLLLLCWRGLIFLAKLSKWGAKEGQLIKIAKMKGKKVWGLEYVYRCDNADESDGVWWTSRCWLLEDSDGLYTIDWDSVCIQQDWNKTSILQQEVSLVHLYRKTLMQKNVRICGHRLNVKVRWGTERFPKCIP